MRQEPADRLRTARHARGFRTAKAFADKHGIPQPTYALHESGKRSLSRDVGERYAGLLEIPVEWLLFGRGEPPDLPLPAAATTGARLKALRERAGLSIRDLAAAIGSGVRDYEKLEKRGKNDFLSKELVADLANVFTPRGVQGQDLLALAGAGGVSGQVDRERSERPRADDQLAETIMVQELDVRAAAGGGGVDPAEIGTDAPVVAEWQVPIAWVHQLAPGPAPNLKFITVVGDSMVPDFPPNQKVMVDISDRSPTPPGIFVVWDGLGLVVKRVQHIPFSEPPRVEIASTNPAYRPYDRVLGEAHIQGRVVGRWQPT